MLLGGAVAVVDYRQREAVQARDHPAAPLSDGDARDQVVDAVLAIVRAAELRDPAGAQAFRPCTASDGPPYAAVVHLTFAVGPGNSVGYLDDVADAMIDSGWADAATPAEHFGRKLTRPGLLAEFYRNPERIDVATMQVRGECRVVGDHRSDDPVWVDLTERLRAAG